MFVNIWNSWKSGMADRCPLMAVRWSAGKLVFVCVRVCVHACTRLPPHPPQAGVSFTSEAKEGFKTHLKVKNNFKITVQICPLPRQNFTRRCTVSHGPLAGLFLQVHGSPWVFQKKSVRLIGGPQHKHLCPHIRVLVIFLFSSLQKKTTIFRIVLVCFIYLINKYLNIYLDEYSFQ